MTSSIVCASFNKKFESVNFWRFLTNIHINIDTYGRNAVCFQTENLWKIDENYGPQDFSLGMIKAYTMASARGYFFSLCDNSNKSYREKTEDTLARKPPC